MIAALPIPNPMHPALVHFPIVLILLGTGVAVVAAIVRRWNLPAIAAVLFVLGAIGAAVAVETGEEEGELAGTTAATEKILDQHQSWAERTQTVSILVAVLAVAAAATSRWPTAARALSGFTAAGALVAAWCVAQTGHYGGQLVFRHGTGVNVVAASGAGAVTAGKPVAVAKQHSAGDSVDD